jgi:hypothetical protein
VKLLIEKQENVANHLLDAAFGGVNEENNNTRTTGVTSKKSDTNNMKFGSPL